MKFFTNHSLRQFLKVTTLSLFLVSLVFSPRVAFAQVTVLGDVQRVVQGSTGILDTILKGLETSAQVALKNSIRVFLDKIAYDTAVWIASGDSNQKPLLFTKDVGTYIQGQGDAAVGEFLNTIAKTGGLDLCSLPQAQGLRVQILVNRLFDQPEAAQVKTANCSASQIAASAQNSFDSLDKTFTEAKIEFASNPVSIITFANYMSIAENPLLTYVQGLDKATTAKAKAQEEAQIERLKNDFKDQKSKVSGNVETSAESIKLQNQLAAEKAADGETTLTGNVVADSLNIFTNTLLSKLMDKAKSGLLSFFTQSDINESLRGSSSTTRSGGIRAAREQFASYKTPPISSTGTVDILSQFATCPSEGADVVNCVITDEFRSAIDEQKTVKQLVDDTNLGNLPFGLNVDQKDITSPEEGFSLRNITILRQYSVLPVGWELAAQYHKNYDQASSLTLRDVMDKYDDCGTDNYSPYCGLVDPNWVLKSPEVFCKVEGYAENIGATSFIDADGNPYTPEQLQVNRLKSCVDAQTCLSQDDTGACEAYGYCTKQEDIYRFEGESCPAEQVSCEVFTDSTGTQNGYLKDTLNYNGCTSDSDGCAWRCTVYNTVDKEFQCKGEDTIYKTCTNANGCRDNLVQADGSTGTPGCSIANGGFRCSADDKTWYLSGSDTNTQYSINFDNDVQPCDEANQSCTTFIPQIGSNLISNPSFESFNNFGKDPASAATSTDEFGGAALAFAEVDGSACVDETGGACRGWLQADGASGGNGWRVVTDAASGKVGVESQIGDGQPLTTRVETGVPLANRSFVLSYSYLNASGSTCDDQGTATAEISAGSAGRKDAVSYAAGTGYQTIALQPYTFGAGVTATDLNVEIGAPRDCHLIVDNVSLIEITNASVSTAYQDYGGNALHLKTDVAAQCNPSEVGCQLYTPQTGGTRLPVPGRVTNPLSEACGNGTDFTNPSCSQCFQGFVGCQAFVESDTPYQAPLKTFVAGLPEEVAPAVAARTGYYCSGTTTSCNPSRAAAECGSGVACVPSVSVVPSTGDSCSAQDVGCEQYVNIDSQGAGGEGLEYYNYIRQCVKPTETQVAQGLVDTYYSFEGSDQTGYQIRSWYLKKSNIDAGPCTNLDLTGGTAQSADAACVDTTETQAACSVDELGVNPNCTEYFDAAGNRYYRLKSATISVSDSCTALRNSADNRIYYTIPSESVSCSATAVSCREYKGAAAGNQSFIIDADFDTAMWGGGTSSSTVVSANSGQSMQIGSNAASREAATLFGASLSQDKSYVATLWAKGDANSQLTAFVNNPTTGTRQTFATITLSTEWKQYNIGPFISSEALGAGAEFGFSYQGANAYIDNVRVFENNSIYMIKGSATSCNGYEGCQEYKDPAGNTSYLKSFEKLCDEKDAGCTALFNTKNSTSPFTERFKTDNESASDDVVVSADQPETRIVTPASFCDAASASCQAFGLPSIDASNKVAGFETQYLLNNVDFYSNSLCANEQLSCKEYAAADGSVQYFKDPGNKTCEYDEGSGSWKTKNGDPCPLQNPSDAPSQPKGPVCNRGPRAGELCSTDSECPTADDGKPSRCVSNLDNQSGYVGICNAVYAGCTNYLDPNSASVDSLQNTSFETDVFSNDNINNQTPDNRPDYWSAYLGSNPYQTAINAQIKNCTETRQSDKGADQFSGQFSLKITAPSNADCMAAYDSQISVDSNKIYTLSAKVKAGSAAKFAVGLLFEGPDGNLLQTPENTPESYAITAYDGGDRGDIVDGWVSYHALIGPNQLHQFPEGTVNVRVFVESYNGRVFFDDVELSEADVYSYINSSVDGAPEGDVNTCNGVVDEGQGCVAFQEMTASTNNTLSDVEVLNQVNGNTTAVVACQTRASDGAVVCDGTANAANSNVVLQVKRDRQCSEWLTCGDSNPVNINGQIVNTCTKFTTCTKRNEDTGECTQFVQVPNSNALSQDSVVSAVSQPGAGFAVASIKDYSGLTKAGMRWLSAEGNEVAQSKGYYPVDWMPEQGVAGVKGTVDLIPNNDFESVQCDGDSTANTTVDSAVSSSRDFNQACTIDAHCRVQDTETAAQTALRAAGQTMRLSTIDYSSGWCKNVSRTGAQRSWKDWHNFGNAEMTIIDYDEARQYETLPDNGADGSSLYSKLPGISNPFPVAAKSLDLNNVMYVQPVNNQESGLEVNISSRDLSSNGQYVLSFDAKYIQDPQADTTDHINAMTAGIRIGDTPYYFTDAPDANPFRLSTAWTRYTLGPVTVGNFQASDGATIFIGQVDGALDNAFLIDNVSLKPALEVSADGGVAGSKSEVRGGLTPNLVSRSCRAYPTETSASCNYTDSSGVIYSGWKGYCLEKDPLHANGCIAWWPVSTITGESDLSRAGLKMRWTDQAPVYHCLVAKGNEDLGFCENSGELCNTSAECDTDAGEICIANQPTGICQYNDIGQDFGNTEVTFEVPVPIEDQGNQVACNADVDCRPYAAQYPGETLECNTANDPNYVNSRMVSSTNTQNNVNPYDIKHSYSSKDYSLTHTLNSIYVDQDTSHTAESVSNQEYATFLKLGPDQLKLEELVHLSEISDIRLYDGEPQFDGTTSANAVESAKNTWKIGKPLYGEDQNLASALSFIEQDAGTTDPSTTGNNEQKYDFSAAGLIWDIFERNWDNKVDPAQAFHFDDGSNEDKAGVYAVQTGLWCGSSPCSALVNDRNYKDVLGNADFVYVKGVGSFSDNQSSGANLLFSAGRVANNHQALNPFERFSADLGPGSEIWNKNGKIDPDEALIADYRIQQPDAFFKYFVSRNANSIGANDIIPQGMPNCFGGIIGNPACGNNIYAVKFDFEGGYLKNVYIVIFNGFRRADPKQFTNISWEFDLKEVCLLAVNSASVDAASSTVKVMPWRTRVNRATPFIVPGLGYTYQLGNGGVNFSNILFGMLALNGKAPDQLEHSPDYLDGQKSNITGKAGTLPLVYATNGEGSGLPFACIGSCTEMVCQQDSPYEANTFDPNNGSACQTDGNANQWISLEGVCVQDARTQTTIIKEQSSVPCDPAGNVGTVSQQCRDAGAGTYCKPLSEHEKKGGNEATLNQKLATAAASAWGRYRTLFADIAEPTVYIAEEQGDEALGHIRNQEHYGELRPLSIDALSNYIKPGDNTPIPNNAQQGFRNLAITLSSFSTIPLCPNNERPFDTSVYCAVTPEVENIVVQGVPDGLPGNDPITVQAGQRVTIQFGAKVDKDQQPLNQIAVQYQANPANTTFEPDLPAILWEGVPLANHTLEHIYTCNSQSATYSSAIGDRGGCEYEVRIQVKDYWGMCNLDSAVERTTANARACQSYAEYSKRIEVEL